ncbi:DUF5626 family protein [Lentibacillus sp. N15]|uniref:DUF5626 family protein n=1 Tax=Lentibacillus songyuanensis TaxID=3136161 RepID=UPI0031B9B644
MVRVFSCYFRCSFFGSHNASAAELEGGETIEFDALNNGVQTSTYKNEDGEEVTIQIEPISVDEENKVVETNKANKISPMLTPGHGHLFPYGTTKGFKISANTPYMGWSYKVNVSVPKDTSKSKFTKVYDGNYHVLLGSLSNVKLTKSNKTATYSADVSWLGGLGGANAYLKAKLSGNKITVSSRM